MLLASKTDLVISYLKENRVTKVAHITTAQKGVPEKEQFYIDNQQKKLHDNGIDYEEIDLDDYDKNSLFEKIEKFKAVYVAGGNTYYLLKAVRSSGFDKIIKNLLNKGLFYIGASAGAYIMCPSIEMAGWKDSDIFNHYGVTDLAGINLVPFLIKCHYDESIKDLVEQRARETKYEIKVLRDNQAFLFEDDSFKLISS